MDSVFTADDDLETIEAIKEHARLLRRRGSAKAAHTASKVELLLSKAIEEQKPASQDDQT